MKKLSTMPYVVWSLLFIIAPLIMIVYFALTKTDVNGNIYFTLETFLGLFTFKDPVVVKALIRSFVLAIQTTIICLIIGYPVAYILTKYDVKTEKMLVLLLVLPMWMNSLLRTYAIKFILSPGGLIARIFERFGIVAPLMLYNEKAVLFGMVYDFLPFMIIPIYTIIKKIDKNLIYAAQDLGADMAIIFRKIIIPLSIPGIITGVNMTFMPSVSTFVISQLLGGGKADMIGNLIEQQFTVTQNWNFGASLSLLLMILIIISTWILNKFDYENEETSLW